mmetsp:Transcript_13259/g.18774  ORF Transcript_13259/g.18774 Transcript_13259/m.18774 type:complete len:641 (+) Transcript_13259:134-2056(+)
MVRRNTKTKKKVNEPLRTLVQKRLITDVFENTKQKTDKWCILVLDKMATRVISSALGMYDLMEERVAIVEDLTKKRAPYKDKDVIYLLSQTSDSVDRLVGDWSGDSTLYGSNVFVYFLGRLPDKQLNKIKQCKPLLKRIKAFTEVNVDFLAKEKRAFTFDMRSAFSRLYLRDGPTVAELNIAEKLVTVCATLNEYPHIRWKASSALGQSLANLFHVKMNDFIGANENWWYHGDGNNLNTARSTLLVLDRADDCISPLMHEFTYQAMVNDLLPMEDDKLTYQAETGDASGATQDKDVLLNDNDELWVELRGKHIADVVGILSNRIRDIASSGAGANLSKQGKGGVMSMKQMADTVKKLPEYKEVMSKLSQHMSIAHQCLDIFTKESLMDLAELEQTLATGQTDEGTKPRTKDLVNEVCEYVQQITDASKKVRLLAILIIGQNGLQPQDKDKVMAAAQLSRREEKMIENLAVMGIPLVSSGEEKKSGLFGMGGLLSAASATPDDDSEYQGSRYDPPLQSILEDLCNNRLSIEDFPSAVPLPDVGSSTGSGVTSARSKNKSTESARSRGGATSRWKRTEEKKKAKEEVYSGGRQIIFMAGGMCFSELRVIEATGQKEGREILAGTTHFVKPTQFLKDLGRLKK